MKRQKLWINACLLSLLLALGGGFQPRVYASGGDDNPQGLSGTQKAATTADQSSTAGSSLATLISLIGRLLIW